MAATGSPLADVVTRFAPSPTGFLHLGHAHSALFGNAMARRAGGRFLLRIEDIDAGRCRPGYAIAIEEDLAWLGLCWERPVRRQSSHMEEYRAALTRLAALGVLYPCFCTRAAIAREVAAAGYAPHGPEGPPYPGTCRRLARAEREERLGRGDAHALRLDMTAALAEAPAGDLFFEELGEGRLPADPAPFGDVVLARKDVPASYHLCVCHDDAAQGVTVVTRGADLKPATALHRLLQSLLGWPEPLYAHHPLLTDVAGRRLAKREGAPSIRSLREAGHSPAAVRTSAGFPDRD